MAKLTEHCLQEVNTMMKKWGFNEDERNLVVNIGDTSDLLTPLLTGVASIKFTKSLATWTRGLTILTCILAISTAIQVYMAFYCSH
jgi:hypothetical protein